MTSLQDRPNTALLVVDMQNDVVANAFELERVVGNINALVGKARAENVPVIWVQHSDDELPHGSEGWRYIADLDPGADEPLVHKNFGDSFEETTLESLLEELRVGRLVVTGAQTDACIRATLHGALVRGYDATLVEDAHTTEDLRDWGGPLTPEQAIAYTNMYWGFSNAPGRRGSTVATEAIEFTSSA